MVIQFKIKMICFCFFFFSIKSDFFHEIQTSMTLACSKKAKTKASKNMPFQSKLTVGASLRLPQSRACLKAPALVGKKQQFLLGRKAGMAGWGTGR